MVSDVVGVIEGGVISGNKKVELTLTFPLSHTESNRDLGFVISPDRKITELQIQVFEDPVLLPTGNPRAGGTIPRDPAENKISHR